MNGTEFFLDTNIVLYFLNGDENLKFYIENKTVYISFITELELLGFKDISELEKKSIIQFFSECEIIDINPEIKNEVIQIRSKKNIKLPDAIILASAKYCNLPLITADKQVASLKEFEVILYSIEEKN